MRLSGLRLRVGIGLAAAGIAAGPVRGGAQVLGRAGAYAGLDVNGSAQTVEAALRAMGEQAAVVFVGTVSSVTRVGGDGFAAATGVVEVTFAVEQPVRGCAGGSYLLREWGGLWPGSTMRYRVGSRLLMLLHAPGVSGLSSPVGGMDGAIPVRASRGLVAAEDAAEATSEPVADLRWLAARLVRGTGYAKPAGLSAVGMPVAARARALVMTPVSAAAAGQDVAANAIPEAAGAAGNAVSESVAAMRSASTPAAAASVTTVLEMLNGWAKESGDAR